MYKAVIKVQFFYFFVLVFIFVFSVLVVILVEMLLSNFYIFLFQL